MQSTTSVTIALATYRRNDLLAALLPLLEAQCAAVPGSGVLVVDNDPEGGAAEVVTSRTTATGGLVRYVHEPTPGISAARNRALDEAPRGLLIFLDDDEIPAQDWLVTLLDCHDRFGGTAVTGPVVPHFEIEPDPWIRGTGVFERRQRATGTLVRGAASNNLLLDTAELDRLGVRFDPAFGLSGGSDTMLSYRITAEGGRIVWCDEAEVTDLLPANRLTRSWVRTRIFRTSSAWSRIDLILHGTGARRRALLTLRGARRMLLGVPRWVAGTVLRRPELQGAGAHDLISGRAIVVGAFGHVHYEYAR